MKKIAFSLMIFFGLLTVLFYADQTVADSKKVVKKLSLFNQSHYSLDFIFDDNKKPILVEMNTTPGFDLLRIVGTESIKKLNFELFVKSMSKLIK